MAKDPAFLFYSSDFLTGCLDLTMEERGQYITILCLQHQKGRLKEKTIRLSVGNVSVDVLQKFKTDEDGMLYNERLENEIAKRLEFTESRRRNGSKGGRPKKKQNETIEKPLGLASENLTENEDENINNSSLRVSNTYLEIFEEIKSDYNLSDKMEEQIMLWLKYKSEKGQSYKKTGLKTFITRLIKYSDNSHENAEMIIEKSIANNYAGIFELNQNDKKKKIEPVKHSGCSDKTYSTKI